MEIGHIILVVGDCIVRMPLWAIILIFIFGAGGIAITYTNKGG